MLLRRLRFLGWALLLAVVCPVAAGEQEDLAAARSVFDRNLEAIRKRDREAYLACYLDKESFARTGPPGMQTGFREHAARSVSDPWPDLFEGLDLRLVRVSDGVVYGTYRYRVRYGATEDRGLSERLFVRTPAGWRIAMTSAFSAPPGTPPPPRALTGGILVDGRGGPPVRDSVVVMREGRIECAGTREACPVPGGVETMDVRGTWITPGLIDAHVHFSQTGWADGRPDALDARDRNPYEETVGRLRAHPETFFRSYLCSGVTAVFDVGGYAWTVGLVERAENDPAAPRVAAAGPLVTTRDHWINMPAERQFMHATDPNVARAGVSYLAALGSSAVKFYYIVEPGRTAADYVPLAVATVEEAKARGIPVLSHATGLEEARESLRAGVRMLVHSVWDKPVDDEFLELARRQNAVYCPTLTVRDGYMKMYQWAATGERPANVPDDPRSCVDPDTRARLDETPRYKDRAPADLARRLERLAADRAVMDANLMRVSRAGITVAMGTDAGNPLTLHGVSVNAEMEAMQAAGMKPMDVLVASTLGSARAMGREKDLGTIESGKAADLLVLDNDPTASVDAFRAPRWIVRGGVVRGARELGY
ncbi:MAG: amidohydrolase family protein [Candidatus Polarisedimenticolia bacterium]